MTRTVADNAIMLQIMAGADPKEFFDNRFIKELEDTGFVRELYGSR